MSRIPRTAIALAVVSGVAAAGWVAVAVAAPRPAVRNAHIVERSQPCPFEVEGTRPQARWATSLAAVDVKMDNTLARANIRLYADDGTVDRAAARTFMRVACSVKEASLDGPSPPREPLPERLVQLVFRASYHFGGAAVSIVSATRPRARGKHRRGKAIDFRLEGVRASKLAAWLRKEPRAGVGIYTHPKTQYVHLDVRDRSFHWLDASPPGVKWRERRMRDPKQAERDAAYVPAMDLPESAQP